MVNPTNPKYTEAFQRILQIMNDLREKCPWDRKQTLASIRHLTIEEVYELSDAILSENMEEIKKELGDVLLHIIFYSKIADETEHFDIADVIHSLCDKLIRRHPHVYGDAVAEDEHSVKRNWELLKLEEKNNNAPKSVLDGVPKSLPALVKAIRIQEKARGVGFDWDDKSQVWKKVEEELAEFKANFDATKNELINPQEAEKEFGDLLFSLVNYARFININPESALEKTNQKFIGRFQYLERESQKEGKSFGSMTLQEMDYYWEQAKKYYF